MITRKTAAQPTVPIHLDQTAQVNGRLSPAGENADDGAAIPSGEPRELADVSASGYTDDIFSSHKAPIATPPPVDHGAAGAALRELSRVHDCEILRIINQGHQDYRSTRIDANDGRCEAISSIHAYSQLHDCPQVWEDHIAESNRHTAFSMRQRGASSAIRLIQQMTDEKTRSLEAQHPPGSWWASVGRLVSGSPKLTEIQQKELQSYIHDLNGQYLADLVPGATHLSITYAGEQTDLAKLIEGLPSGVHVLRAARGAQRGHTISCTVTASADQPSILMDPNGCEWRGSQRNLGRLLADFWNQTNFIEQLCRGGEWMVMTYSNRPRSNDEPTGI